MTNSFDRLSNTYLPSDPDFLLEYMAGLASDNSDDDFDGYLLSDEEPEEQSGKLDFNIIVYNRHKFHIPIQILNMKYEH